MKQSKTGRVLAILFLGVLFGLYRHYQQMRALGLGRDGFLAEQGHYFDKISQYHSMATMLIAGVIVAAVTFGLYEVIAAAATKAIPPSEVED
jgi:hypothetical protein